jgi:hypothetical protein
LKTVEPGIREKLKALSKEFEGELKEKKVTKLDSNSILSIEMLASRHMNIAHTALSYMASDEAYGEPHERIYTHWDAHSRFRKIKILKNHPEFSGDNDTETLNITNADKVTAYLNEQGSLFVDSQRENSLEILSIQGHAQDPYIEKIAFQDGGDSVVFTTAELVKIIEQATTESASCYVDIGEEISTRRGSDSADALKTPLVGNETPSTSLPQ